MKSFIPFHTVAVSLNSHQRAERFRRVNRLAVVGLLVVGLVLAGAVVDSGPAEVASVGGGGGSGSAGGGVGSGEGGDGDKDASTYTPTKISFTCERVRVVPYEGHSYELVIYYVDTASGERGRALVGPFDGPFDDHFGKTDILFTEVEVRYRFGERVSATIPKRCR